MAKVREIVSLLEKFAPKKYAGSTDNVGLLVGSGENEVSKVLITLDITDEVIEEAKEEGFDMIVSHHPLFINPIKSVTNDTVEGKRISELIKNGISALCMHTNMDNAPGGVNFMLADALGLSDVRALKVTFEESYRKIVVYVPPDYQDGIIKAMTDNGAGMINGYTGCTFVSEGLGTFTPGENSTPFVGEKGKSQTVLETRIEMICPKNRVENVIKAMKTAHPYEVPAYDIFEDFGILERAGIGGIGVLKNPMTKEEFFKHVSSCLKISNFRYAGTAGIISTVAVCGGSGAGLLDDAEGQGADAYVTADLKYHDWQKASMKNMLTVDAGHYATENPICGLFYSKLCENFKELTVKISTVHKDCINFFRTDVE